MRATLALLLLAAAPAGAGVLPEGRCAVLVASRPDLPGIAGWVAANPGVRLDALYRTRNGQYALSAGIIATEGWRGWVAQARMEGAVPADAFCSGAALAELLWYDGGPDPRPWAGFATAAPQPLGPSPFDARPLDPAGRAALQAALAIEGAYRGILDGRWGRASQEALDGWARGSRGRDAVQADAGPLLAGLEARLSAEGWDWIDPSGLGVPLLLPLGRLAVTTPEAGRRDYQGDDLLVIVSTGSAAETVGLHAGFAGEDAGAPYTLREPDRWITAGRLPAGDYYLRSEQRGAVWVNALVSGGEDSGRHLVIASIGVADRPALPGLGGTRAAVAAAPAATPPASVPAAPVPPASALTGDEPQSSGTAFRVTADGTFLTNHHVIADCTRITVGGTEARVAGSSAAFDLAALSVAGDAGAPAVLPFAPEGPRLNADVTAAGFPLRGFLDGLNVTRGSITALRGIHADENRIQISAQIHPGNSGGPVVDKSGRAVGVVVSTAAAEAVLAASDALPQNLNYAIRGDVAQLFLTRQGIAFTTAPPGDALAPEDLADRLAAATALVLCY